ncbi:DegT/DnrJ/EryC1/StrS family aminotransferase, partial [Micromonospora chokoriensis]|uniref:DegT/DnrJ/EryC1/StrS family aminotransferase n=1 Tax=Micromonospora chokoriensis TaxID=356851 RepID=UPI0004C3E474
MSELALTGGTAAVAGHLHRPWPEITLADRQAIDGVLDRGVLAGPNAPEIRSLEEEYAQYVGVRHCVATNAGTSALHAALAAAGVGPEHEVIVPAYTFVASAFAVAQQGARVVFCDVDEATGNLDATRLEGLITRSTRAIMAVHIHGQPADMDEINAIAARNGVLVVEDSSQAHGTRYRGRRAGGLAHAAGASMNHSKNLPAGEGGLFTTDDEVLALTARRLVLYGEDVIMGQPRQYWSHGLGWNYRGHEMTYALARSQLRRLDSYNERARENADRLTKGLAGLAGIDLPRIAPDRESSFWRYSVRVQPEELGFDGDPRELRDRIVRALSAEGVEAFVWQPQPIPAQPAFRRHMQAWHPRVEAEPLRPWEPSDFPIASRLCDTSFSLGTMRHPLYVQDPELMDLYVVAVRKVLANIPTVMRMD